MLRGGAGEPQRAVRAGAVARLLRRLLRRVSDAELHDLAVAVEAFSRAPADLADGCELFPGQVQAAIGLMQNYVIQMDTGEGKTYALLPAAFALACQYRNVYIVCANDYLARRDATRTRRFWDFVGLIPESGPITATPASGPVGSSTLPCPTC
jgi:preprotein translocase subunit SecA